MNSRFFALEIRDRVSMPRHQKQESWYMRVYTSQAAGEKIKLAEVAVEIDNSRDW